MPPFEILPPAFSRQKFLTAAKAPNQQALAAAAASRVDLFPSASSSDAVAAAEESTLRGSGGDAASALQGDTVVVNGRSRTPSDSSTGSSREEDKSTGGNSNNCSRKPSASEAVGEEAVSLSSPSSGGILESDSTGGTGVGTSAPLRDHEFGWSSAAGNTVLQNRMCRALKANHHLALEFILFALSLIDASSFAPGRQAASTVERRAGTQREHEQTPKQQSGQERQLKAGGPQHKQVLKETEEKYPAEHTGQQYQRASQYQQQPRQQQGSQETSPGKTLTDDSALDGETAERSRSGSRSKPFQTEEELAESSQNKDGLVSWKAVTTFIEKLQERAVVTDDLRPQYAWQNRAPCRLLPLAATQLQRIVWSVEEAARRRTKQGPMSTREATRSAKTSPLMLHYDRVIDELLDKASKRTEKIRRGKTSSNTSNGNAGTVSWDTKRMKALAQSVPKLASSETTLEVLLSATASLWSSYLVITDLEAGRTVEAVVEETAGQRINTVKRRYGNALHVLSETSKEILSDGHLCGHIFVLLEGFVSPSVVELMPWYNVAYFEGELLRYLQEELTLSLKPLEEAFSVADVYKAERAAGKAAAVRRAAAAPSSEVAVKEGSSQRPQEMEEKGRGHAAATEEASVERSAQLKIGMEKRPVVGDKDVVNGLPLPQYNRKSASRQSQEEVNEEAERMSHLPRRQRLHASADRRSKETDVSGHRTNSSRDHRWKVGLARDRANDTSAEKGARRRVESGVHREAERRTQFKNSLLPEVRLTGYHVSTLHGTFNAGVVGEFYAFEVNEKLRKAFTEDGVLVEIQLCQKRDAFFPLLAKDEPDITEWRTEPLHSERPRSTAHSKSGNTGDYRSSETRDWGHIGNSSVSGSSLNIGAGRRLESVGGRLWNAEFENTSTRRRNGPFNPVFTDPPGARVSAKELRHMGAVAAAASGASAAATEAAAAAAAAARRDAAAAAAGIDTDGDGDDDDDYNDTRSTTISRNTGGEAVAPPTKQGAPAAVRLRAERASLRYSHLPSPEEGSRSAGLAGTPGQALEEAATPPHS